MLCLIFIIIPTLSSQVVQSLFHNDSRIDHGSCRFRSVRQAEYNWNSPEQSITESFVLDDIEYKLCRYHVTWDEAMVFCSSHKAHLATLDSEEKTAFVVAAIASISSVAEEYWIGAKQIYEEPWKWNSNGMTLSSEEDIISKIPIRYPGFESNHINCLTIDRSGHNEAIFVPRACNRRRSFICQRNNDRVFDNKIRMSAATKIGEQEFRLYAGRTTWAEAVVHCRQEGLQLGEINTVEEARALAISMLRNRPEGIESVWIGGYSPKDDESTWRWIASGKKIENIDMWRKDLSESFGGCLLLDRHVCESPVYVASSCDRKRDVLCQKPPKKLLSKKPMPVVVDDCPYWVGFYPLKWSDAKRACESLNASLVVLDSPATISHMMSLMLDNKAELRHIWTNGRRSKPDRQWIWDVTGESIPDFGKSFIPWCPDDDYYTKENSCLNLDREKLDSPLVYGLSCREKQTYVCQPYIGDCVYHSAPNLPLDAMINASEDIEEETTFKYPSALEKYMATLAMSTITTPFSIANFNDDIIQTTLHTKISDLSDFTTWKSTENIVKKNSSSQRKFTEYLKPFTSFTLPSLPQFGIKVVSATDATTNLPSIDKKKKKNKAYKLLTTSSHSSTATNLPPSSSSFKTLKKDQSDGRKAYKDQSKMSNFSNSHGQPISSLSTDNTNEKSSKIVDTNRPAFTQISPSLQSFLGPKNSSKSSKTSKISTTSSSIISDDSSDYSSFQVESTKKYSMKTTRDVTSLDSVTAKSPESANPTNERIIKSDSKKNQNLSSKSTVSFIPKKLRPDSKLVAKKRPTFRITTEAMTPYDAIDVDYYNDDKYDDKTTKKSVEVNARKFGKSVNYSSVYRSIPRAKPLTKKKSKQTSTASLRKNLPSSAKAEEEEEEEEDEDDDEDEEEDDDEEEEEEEDEEEEEEEESSEEKKKPKKPSIPIAADLSKNLENFFVTMIRNRLDKKKGEKSGESSNPEKIDIKTASTQNAALLPTKEDEEALLKSVNVENLTLRPYYAFEGPMNADLPEVPKREGSDREFIFIGSKLTPEGFQLVKNIENESQDDLEKKLVNNKTQSNTNNQQSVPQNSERQFPISMVGMPPIQPNDPNAMMQLGRYFKNQFEGFQHGSNERRTITIPRAAIEGQRRLRPTERPFLQERIRGYPVNRGQDIRNNGQQWNKPLKRHGLSESDANYYRGERRLYPRGNYDIHASPTEQERRNNVNRLRNARDQLDIALPDKYVGNYDNFDPISKPVSPRSSSAPRRNTRSSHEKTPARNVKIIEKTSLPDFKLSKLVKEVKIDLDQRTLRRYLEGLSRKISRKNPRVKVDDWKDSWRQLLRQMLLVIDRMNINVNGNLMKLRVASENEKFNVFPGNFGKMKWKLGQTGNEQRRTKLASKNYANLVKKMNESLRINSTVKIREKLMRAPLNNLQIKESPEVNSKPHVKDKSTDGYRKIYDHRETTTRSSMENEKMKITTTSFPGLSKHRQERTDKPIVDHRENSYQMLNISKSKYTNFNNTPINKRPESIIPQAKLSTIFGYRSLMPQLHHRIVFQPGWAHIQTKSEPQKSGLRDESLPRESLSKVVTSMKKNEHFETPINEAQKPGHNLFASTNLTESPGNIDLAESLKNSSETKNSVKFVNERKMGEDINNLRSKFFSVSETSANYSKAQEKSNEVVNHRDKVADTDNNVNEAWKDVTGYIERNKLRNDDFDEDYNATYVEETNDRKIDDQEESRDMEEEIVDEQNASPEDYDRNPIWTPAHRLGKAMELSILRKYGRNPSDSLRSKNLVTRSVKQIEAINPAKTPETSNKNIDYTQRRKIEQRLENLNEEPSVISLRMIMDPERRSSRILKQSQNLRTLEKKSPSVELHVQFSGKQEPTKARQIYSRNHLTQTEKINKTSHDSLLSESGGNLKDKNVKPIVAMKGPSGFVDKERRRAMLNLLLERNRKFERNHLKTVAKRKQTETKISDSRDRGYRNVGLGIKSPLNETKAMKVIPDSKNHVATSLKSFNEKNLTNSGKHMWKKGGKFYGKKMGVDWAEEASALYADLEENNDDLTLYIDLTLGRVGSKPRFGGRSKG